MNLTSPRTVKDLLKKYSAHPIKGLGQHFLTDKTVLQKIIKAADLKKNDIVLEIGPGLGILTLELAKRVKRVIAVEKDKKMCEILKEVLECCNVKNVEIIQGDILKLTPGTCNLKPKTYKVIANLPYYIVSPTIRRFLELSEVRPQSMVLMVQKEVAQRIVAQPPDMNLLAVSVQFYAKPEIISFVSKKSFWPSPKVDSAILRIAPLITTDRKRINADLFFKIVKAGFSQPRKQLINNLSKGLKQDKEKIKNWLLKNKIQPTQRAETLDINGWMFLTKSFA